MSDEDQTLGDYLRHPATLATGIVGGLNGVLHMPLLLTSWDSLELVFSGLRVASRLGESSTVEALMPVVGVLVFLKILWRLLQRFNSDKQT